MTARVAVGRTRCPLSLPERLVLADKQDVAFQDLLLMILTHEIARRDNTDASALLASGPTELASAQVSGLVGSKRPPKH